MHLFGKIPFVSVCPVLSRSFGSSLKFASPFHPPRRRVPLSSPWAPMAALRLARLAKLLSPAKNRPVHTLVYVGKPGSLGKTALVTCIYADPGSKLGQEIAEEVMKLRNDVAHYREVTGTSAAAMDPAEDESDQAPPKGDVVVVTRQVQCGGWRIDDPTFWDQRAGYDKQRAEEEMKKKDREERNAEEAAERYRANHRFDRLESVMLKGFQDVVSELKPVKMELVYVKESADAEHQEARCLRKAFDDVRKSVDFLKKREELRSEAAATDKLWVYRMMEQSVSKLPWGLPGYVKGVGILWENFFAVYPFAAGTFLYVRYSINPLVYLELTYLYNDEMIEPYLKKIKQLQKKAANKPGEEGNNKPEEDDDEE